MDLPPAPDSPKNILNVLDDDCIGEILRRLKTLDDVVSMAATCTRFQACVQATPSRFKAITIENDSTSEQFNNVSAHLAPLLLENFGHSITSINWTPSGANLDRSDEIYASMVRFCGKTLKDLYISNYNPKISKRNFFESLDNLELINAKPKYVRYDPQIKDLRIKSNGQKNPWYIKCPLTHLRVLNIHSDDHLTDEMFSVMLKRNYQLKIFILINCERVTPGVFKQIGTYFENLKALIIYSINFHMAPNSVMNENVVHLKALKKLQYLYLNGNISTELLFNMLAGNGAPITDLRFHPVSTDTAQNLPTLKTLRQLTVGCTDSFGGFSDDFVLNLVRTQTALNELTIRAGRTVSMQGIIEILKTGKNLTKLWYCSYYYKMDLETYNMILGLAINRVNVELVATGEIDVPKETINANSKWLKIHGECIHCQKGTHCID